MEITEKMTLIAENEQKVYDAGYDKGFADGEAQGGGGDNHYDTFWYSVQENGKRTNYNYAFYGMSWNNTTFKPKYDFKTATSAISMFQANATTELPELNMPSVPALTSTFASAQAVKIGKITVSDNCTFTSTFNWCSKLQDIEFGSIISNNISFVNSSLLTVESLNDIIEHLADKSGDTSAEWTLTIGGTNKAKLTEAELEVAKGKGWQVN